MHWNEERFGGDMEIHSTIRKLKVLVPFFASILILVIILQALSKPLEASFQEDAHLINGVAKNQDSQFAYVCEQTLNMVPNADFEQGSGLPNDWDYVGSCDFDDDLGRSSPTSLLISADEPTNKKCAWYSSEITAIPIESGHSYDFATWAKSDLNQGEAHLAITFWKFHGTWKKVGEPTITNSISGNHEDWVQMIGSVQAPAEAEYASVEAILSQGGWGSVWFDDIFLGSSICLSISKTYDPPQVEIGDILTYTIVYSNTGEERANNLHIVDVFDEDVKFLSAQPSPNIGDNVWSQESLGSQEVAAIEITVRVEDSAINKSILTNRAEIFSNEVLDPISVMVTTPISQTTDTCALSLLLDENQQVGLPGDTVTYDWTIYNTGSQEGIVSLEALSSLNWDIEFAPSTFSLPSAGAKPVLMNVSISDNSSTFTGDTKVTANLNCNFGESIITRTVTTKVFLPAAYLPLTMNNFPPPCWERERNNECSHESSGPIISGKECFGFPNDDRDVFYLTPSSDGSLNIYLEIDDPTGIQLQLRDQSCNLLGDHDWEAPFHIEFNNAKKSEKYYVAVFVEDPDENHNTPYTLWADFP